ncbi:MAG: hypothetical protein ACYSUM_18220 [Planctomycetota bacterium]|jgi:hypothetical protein
MRKLLIVSGVGVVLVAGMALFAALVLGDYTQKDQALRNVFEQRAAALRETDARFPYQARPALDPARFQVYLEVRQTVARGFEARIHEHSRNKFHARRTHNELLKILRVQLDEKRMGLLEYRTTAARWRALLGRREFPRLQAAWRATVTTTEHSDGLPLPDPATDATAKEIELIRRYARLLEESMYADLLDPLLAYCARHDSSAN